MEMNLYGIVLEVSLALYPLGLYPLGQQQENTSFVLLLHHSVCRRFFEDIVS